MLYPTSMGTHKQIRVHFRPSLSKRKKAIGPAMTPPSGNRDAIHDRACSGTSVRSQVQFIIWWGWGQQRAGSTLGRTIDDHPIEHPHENDPKVAWKKKKKNMIFFYFGQKRYIVNSFLLSYESLSEKMCTSSSIFSLLFLCKTRNLRMIQMIPKSTKGYKFEQKR